MYLYIDVDCGWIWTVCLVVMVAWQIGATGPGKVYSTCAVAAYLYLSLQ